MKSQKIMELETLMPTEMDAGQVFTGTPTGKASKATRKRVRTPRPLIQGTFFMNRHGMWSSGSCMTLILCICTAPLDAGRRRSSSSLPHG